MPEWPVVPLSQVAHVNPREPPLGADAPFITMADVDEWGGWARTSGPRGDRGGARARGGDTLMARITPCLENGKIAKVPANLDRVGGSTEFVVLRAGERLLPDFLFLWATSPSIHEAAVGLMTGTTGRQRVAAQDIASLPIAVPSLDEQRRIVDLIGALDAQIAALHVESDAIRNLLSSLREALVETVSWEPIRTITAPDGVQIGPFGSQLHAYDYVDEGVPVVMPQDIVDGEIRTEKIKCVSEETAARLRRHRLRPGDLVLPRRGDLTKRALVREDQDGWLCGTGSIRVRLADRDLAPFLLEGLSTPRTTEWLTTNAVGTTMLNLNTDIVNKMPAPVFTDEGRGLAECCVGASIAAKAMQAEASALRTIRSCLASALLSGFIEVPDSYDAMLAEAV